MRLGRPHLEAVDRQHVLRAGGEGGNAVHLGAQRAVADLIGIADHIREGNPRAAAAVARRVRASIRHLELFPFSGRPTDDPSIRMFPIVRYP